MNNNELKNEVPVGLRRLRQQITSQQNVIGDSEDFCRCLSASGQDIVEWDKTN